MCVKLSAEDRVGYEAQAEASRAEFQAQKDAQVGGGAEGGLTAEEVCGMQHQRLLEHAERLPAVHRARD